jgi:predicted phage terminase large subunit-like protein
MKPVIDGGKGWKHKIYQAIQNPAAIEQGATPIVLWPQVWTYERLLQKQADVGSIVFNCQYQNDPTGLQGDLLKAEWLHPWNEVDSNFNPPANLLNYAGVDVSAGDAESDLYSIATLSHDNTNNTGYLKEIYADRISFPEFLTLLKQKHEIYHYAKIFIESNAFQKILTYLPELKGLPVVPSVTTQNKEARIIPMSAHFQAQRIKINPLISQSSEFWMEWIQFPRAPHDDALDGCEIVIREVVGRPADPEPVWSFG